jgi:hypothetical protein
MPSTVQLLRAKEEHLLRQRNEEKDKFILVCNLVFPVQSNISISYQSSPDREQCKWQRHWGLPYAGMSADQVQAVLSQSSLSFGLPLSQIKLSLEDNHLARSHQKINEDTRSHSSSSLEIDVTDKQPNSVRTLLGVLNGVYQLQFILVDGRSLFAAICDGFGMGRH